MRYAIQPRGVTEHLALWLGLAPVVAIDVLIPLLQVRAVMAGVRLGVFEALREPCTAAQLAQACRLDPRCSELLLRVLSSSRYVRKRGARYALSNLAKRTLLRGAPGELCGYVELNYAQWRWIEHLEETLRSGGGIDLHAALPAGSQAWSAYQRAMLELARPVATLLAKLVPVRSGARRLLDVGGSHGLLGAAICRAHPPLRSTVLELEAALPEARRLAHEEGLSDLVTHRAGDVASGALDQDVDVVLLANILHHLPPATRTDVVQRAFDALAAGGRIAIWETEAAPASSKPELSRDAIALYFQLTSSAPALTGEELRRLLLQSGFADIRLIRPWQARGRVLLHARKPSPAS